MSISAERQSVQGSAGQTIAARWLILASIVLGCLEVFALSLITRPTLYPYGRAFWQVLHDNFGALFTFVALSSLLLMGHADRLGLLSQGRPVQAVVRPLTVHLAAFVLLVPATLLVEWSSAAAASPPWVILALWTVVAIVSFGALALVILPARDWRRLVTSGAASLFLAVVATVLVQIMARESQLLWSTMSDATFRVSAALLSLVEPDVIAKPAEKILGTQSFHVRIAPECSGYEGMGLVTAFLAAYLAGFRQSLRFPNALLLLPIGLVTIWVLNSVRIALLILIGTHWSPKIAWDGFHSQGGWLMFLIVTAGLMYVSQSSPFFARVPRASRPAASSGERVGMAFIVPFVAMMLAMLVAALFAHASEWLYAVKVAFIAAALLAYRRVYPALIGRGVSLDSVVAGLIVGVAWIVTNPHTAAGETLGAWLASLPASLALLWLALRVAGTVLLVPVTEELFFRGYLQRKLIAERFETLPPGAFSWLSFVVATVAFAILHDRWVAAFLAGAVYAGLLYRHNRLTDPIVAHMVSNATIVAWAIMMSDYSLL
ncbi:MAG: exosortase E/protease, VPEID-CTERM system [Hyphomicrobiales bacterium]